MKAKAARSPFTLCFHDTYINMSSLSSCGPGANLTCRKANIVRRDPREERSIKMERIKTSDLASPNKLTRSFLERSTIMKTLLKVVGVFGVSLVMSGRRPPFAWATFQH